MTTKTLNVRVTDTVVTGMCLALLFLLFSNIGWASEDIDENEKKPLRRFGLGAGVGLVRFDTNFKFTEKSSGRSVFVDGERLDYRKRIPSRSFMAATASHNAMG